MTAQKLLIVTKKFWPHCGLTEIALAELATNLAKAGHDITVATVQWSRNWSEVIHFQGIPVIRFARPVAGPWSSFRYARSLARHFTTTSYDAVIVAGVSDESTAVLKTIGPDTPAVLYVDENHFCSFHDLSHKQQENLRSASTIVTPSSFIADETHRNSPLRAELIPLGIADKDRKRTDKSRAREAFAKAHPILAVDPTAPLVISYTTMNWQNELSELIAAWPTVLQRFPKAKLWLIGDGKYAGNLWQQIVDQDLAYSILLPGYFDQMVDVFSAADLYVHASSRSAVEAIIRAQACGCAVVAPSNKHSERVVSHGKTGMLTENCDASLFGRSIVSALENRSLRPDAQEHYKNQLLMRDLSPSTQADRYAKLISSLTDQLVESAS